MNQLQRWTIHCWLKNCAVKGSLNQLFEVHWLPLRPLASTNIEQASWAPNQKFICLKNAPPPKSLVIRKDLQTWSRKSLVWHATRTSVPSCLVSKVCAPFRHRPWEMMSFRFMFFVYAFLSSPFLLHFLPMTPSHAPLLTVKIFLSVPPSFPG